MVIIIFYHMNTDLQKSDEKHAQACKKKMIEASLKKFKCLELVSFSSSSKTFLVGHKLFYIRCVNFLLLIYNNSDVIVSIVTRM